MNTHCSLIRLHWYCLFSAAALDSQVWLLPVIFFWFRGIPHSLKWPVDSVWSADVWVVSRRSARSRGSLGTGPCRVYWRRCRRVSWLCGGGFGWFEPRPAIVVGLLAAVVVLARKLSDLQVFVPSSSDCTDEGWWMTDDFAFACTRIYTRHLTY